MKKTIFALTLLLGSFCFAANRYGDAGCGLGSIVFEGSHGVSSQVFASTTNGTSGSQTFGISSGTSNCIDEGAVRAAKAVPAFIEMNTVSLAKDASRGQGETLATLASLMGCNSMNLGPALQKRYTPIFVDTKMDPTAVEAGINQVIAQDKVACGS